MIRGVKVTARYGWTTVPDAIKLATLIQANRLFARREDTYGPLTRKPVLPTMFRGRFGTAWTSGSAGSTDG